MRLRKPFTQCLSAAFSLGTLTLMCWSFTGTPAAAQYSDPVENLRLLLKNRVNDDDLQAVEARKAGLMAAADRLQTTSELRHGLTLSEWKDTDILFRNTAAADREVRTSIGKRLEEIIKSIVEKGDKTSQLAVGNLLGEMGSTVRALSKADQTGFSRAAAPQLIALLNNKDTQVRQAAARGLGKINPEPKAAVSALKELLQRKGSTIADRRAASEALAEMASKIIELQSKGRTQYAVEADRDDVLNVASQVAPAAGICLNDKDAEVRRHGANAIVQAATALDKLIPSPFDEKAGLPASGADWTPGQTKDVQRARDELAVEAKLFDPLMEGLKGQGKNLADRLDDPSVDVRILARRGFELMGSARAKLMRRADSVPTPKGFVEQPKTEADDPLGKALEPGVAKIGKRISDPSLDVRRATLDFLEMAEDAAAPAIPALIVALGDPNLFIRWAAARTLGRVGPVHTDKTVPALASLVNPKEDPDVREVAANTLKRYGPAAKAALPALIEMLDVGEAESQEAIIKAIMSVGGPETKAAIGPLVKALDSRSSSVRKTAAESLGRMGPLAAGAVPALLDHMQDDDASARIAVSDALVNITRPR